jgi:phage gp36-like protein
LVKFRAAISTPTINVPYVTQSQIEAVIPAPTLADALDDNRDGAPDAGVLDQVIAVAGGEVDGYLASIYSVPFAEPIPAAVTDAAFVFACELIYQRRGIEADKNPFTARALAWRARLQLIGSGKQPLTAETPKVLSPGAIIIDDAATAGGSL